MSGATSPEAETIIRQTQQINTLMDQSASRIERVQRQLDGAYASQQRYEQAQNSINSALERGRITQERANQLLDLNKQRLEQATRATQGLSAANDNASRSVRGSGQVIQQAGFQLQDFFVQVQGGTSALTALAQQGSQFLGLFGPAGAIAGAALAIGAVGLSLIGMGDNGQAAAKKIEDGFRATQRAGEDLTRVVQNLSGELLTAGERAAALANTQRAALVAEGRTHMMRLENERTAAGEQQMTAQRALDRAARDEARYRSMGPGFESELRDVQGQRFQAQAQLDAARSTGAETTRRINELRGLTDRAENVRTGPEEYGPPAPERPRASGGGGRVRSAGPSADVLADRLTRERDSFLAANDPAERYAQALRSIDDLNTRLVASGQDALPQETVLRAQQQALDAYNQTLQGTQRQTDALSQSSKELAGITRGLGDALGKAFEDLVFNGAAATDVLKNLEQQLLRLGNQYLVQPLFQSGVNALFGGGAGGASGGAGGGAGGMIGSLISSLFSSGAGAAGAAGAAGTASSMIGMANTVMQIAPMVFHEGGIVGAPGRRAGPMPAEVFLDAPRYHSGGFVGRAPFANDEVPAVLRRGEMVLTERQQAAVASRSSINQTVIIKAEDPGAFNRTRGQMVRDMRRDLARASRSA